MKNIISYTIITIVVMFSLPNVFANPNNTKQDSVLEKTMALQRVAEVAASPDGKQIGYIVKRIVKTNSGKAWKSFLYLKNQFGDTKLITSKPQISLLRWSPNGQSIAYLTSKQHCIWISNVKESSSHELLKLDREISAFKWSPNGKHIAFVANNDKTKLPTPLTFTNVAKNYTNSRVYLFPANKAQNSNITPIPLTPATVSINQLFPPSLDTGFDWSPDGKFIAYAYQERSGANYQIKPKIAIINVNSQIPPHSQRDLASSESPKEQHAHTIINIPYMKNQLGSQPVYSPDGKMIAFRSNLPPNKEAKDLYNNTDLNSRICVTRITTKQTHCLANTPDQNPGIIGWNASSDQIYVMEWYKSVGPRIYSLNIDDSQPAQLVSKIKGLIEPTTLTFNRNHHVFGFGYETNKNAPQAFISSTSPFKLEQISRLKTPFDKTLGTTNIIHWKSKDGKSIEGLLTMPPNYDNTRKYPLLVDIHGGPSGAVAKRYLGGCDEFGDMVLPPCYADTLNQGFIIFQPNYRGSSGYGLKFRMANFGDFGGHDYEDIMSGVDYLVKKNIADPDHLAILGWSYGGYMTNWAISQSNRFKVAIDGDGLTNLISFSGTSDIPFYLTQYLGRPFWKNSRLYQQRSPILFTKNIKTPLLIIHGKDDIRVPLSQSYELHSALTLQGKPVKMIVFPNQAHVPVLANKIYSVLKESDDWLKKALK